MATGRIRRSARRGLAAAVLGWLGVAALSVVMAPGASAASTYTVHIKDLTPPVASVDAGGKVTFINEIPDKTVQVGGGGLLPSLVSVNAKTLVTLTLPSGDHKLLPTSVPTNPPTTPPTTSVFTEAFAGTCLTCKITYTYQLSSGTSLTSALTSAALHALPTLPVPTLFVVNTLIALPNLPGVNLPTLPKVTVPNVPGGILPTTPGVPGGTTGLKPGQTITTTTTTINGIPGDVYAYQTGSGSPKLSPEAASAASAFGSSRYFGVSSGSGGTGTSGSSSSSGSGGRPGSYDGTSVPVFGQAAGLDGSNLNTDGSQKAAPASGVQTLPVAALAALVALVAVTSALVGTRRAARDAR